MNSTVSSSADNTTHRCLRIEFVIGSLGAGGAERQLLTILKSLDRSRFEPRLFLQFPGGVLRDELPADVPCEADWEQTQQTWWGRVICRLRLGVWLRRWVLASILKRHQIDIVVDRVYLATLDTAVACWLRPTPRLSWCVCDPAPAMEIERKWPHWIEWRFAAWAYRTATRTLTNSAELACRVRDYFRLSPDQIVVQPNMFDTASLERLSNEPCPIARRPGKTLIVASGRLDGQKSHADLIRAVAEVVRRRGPVVEVWILGDGPLRSELDDLVSTSGLTDLVRFVGVLSNPFPAYRMADLFVLSSRFEGLPNVLIEAVLLGVPAIATNCPCGPREILREGELGALVPVGDVGVMASAIEAFLTSPESWRERAKAARAHAMTCYGLEQRIRSFEQLLTEVTLESAPRD